MLHSSTLQKYDLKLMPSIAYTVPAASPLSWMAPQNIKVGVAVELTDGVFNMSAPQVIH